MARPRLVSSTPRTARRKPEESRALLLVIRGVKLLQRERPSAFNHTARGVALILEHGIDPALAAQILRKFPVSWPDEA